LLRLVGLGLVPDHLTQGALKALRSSDLVYMDYYTSLSCSWSPSLLSQITGKRVEPADRELLERGYRKILNEAAGRVVSLACIGDPMISTTHVSLVIEAKRAGIEAYVIPGVSVHCYLVSKSMLSSYKFGRSVTIAFKKGEKVDPTPYQVIRENRRLGLHTVIYLDLSEGNPMDAKEAVRLLLEMEAEIGEGVVKPNDEILVGARLGCEDEKVEWIDIRSIGSSALPPPPHIIIFPGRLNFVEVEAKKCLTSRIG